MPGQRSWPALRPSAGAAALAGNWLGGGGAGSCDGVGENSLAELESYEKPLELALPIPAEAAETAALYPECWLSVEDLQCSCTGGALDVSVTVRVEGAILSRRQASCVGSIALGEKLAPADPEISLRIYYAQAGEALFAIAKRYHVSPGQMLAANDLAEGTAAIEKAQRLLIPGA